MLQMTDRAAEALKTSLMEVDDAGNACVRIGVGEQGLSLSVDQERPEDFTIEYEGKTLVVLDSVLADRLSDRKIDFVEHEGAPQLVLEATEQGESESQQGESES